jgi:hypothetical protein
MSLPEEPSRLDKLQNRLYAKNTPLRKRGRARMSEETVAGHDTFTPIEPMTPHKKLPPTFFKKVFFGSLVIFICALLFAGFMWWQGKRTVSSDRIEITMLGSTFTEGGEELPLEFEILNKNSAELELADLVVEYAKSGVDASEKQSIRIPVGTIGGGKRAVVPVSVVLYGEEGSMQSIDLALEYRIAGSNSVFIKNSSHTVTLSSSPISLFVDAPSSIPPNQEITLDVTLKHDAKNIATGVGLQVEYPFGFQFASAEPAPIKGNNVFSLGDLPEGAEQHVVIKGTMFGEIGEERAFRVYAGKMDAGDETRLGVTYATLVHSLTLEKPFLEATLVYNNAKGNEFTVKPGEVVTASVEWGNNLPLKMNNVELRVKLAGTAFDPSTVKPQNAGFFDSATNTIIWSGDRYRDFSAVEPGESGEVRFTFTPRTTNGAGLIENPAMTASVSIKGNQSSSGNTPEEVSTIEEKTFKVATDLRLSGRTLYHTGPIANTGPLPPRVDQATTYTVVWSITNTTSQATDTVVKATLPIYMTWVGATVPATDSLVYNTASREIVWQPGNIAPKTGGVTSPREVSFKVSLTPSASQLGSSPSIVSGATLSSRDNFTGALLQSSWPALTTRLTADTGSNEGEWLVAN